MADQRMLAAIFNDLLDNARKYSPSGSAVSAAIVRERHQQGAVQRVSVTNQALAGHLPDATRLFKNTTVAMRCSASLVRGCGCICRACWRAVRVVTCSTMLTRWASSRLHWCCRSRHQRPQR